MQHINHVFRQTAAYLFILLLGAVSATAQNVTGSIQDKESKEAVIQATVQLLSTDSTFVRGTLSDIDGNFTLEAPAPGKYIVRVTSVGYNAYTKSVTVAADKPSELGIIQMKGDAVMLKEVVATGMAQKVVLKEDTFVYNAAAYRTPEGSAVEELVKRLPGAQVSDDGKITINGKEVKKIKVDGREFMTGDTETALKNLPTSIIDKVRAYDEKSDLARISGIDDGDDETVLDFGIKAGMNKGIMSNVDLGIGTRNRYTEKGMVAYMKDALKVMGFLSANNVGDKGFGGGRGGGGGRNGLQASKMVGLNINYELDKVLKLDGSVRWNHTDGDVWSRTSAENFLGSTSSFTNSRSQSFSRGDSWNAQMRLEWKPNDLTNIMFRPSVSLSRNDGTSQSWKATFNQDPFLFVANPQQQIQLLKDEAVAVNTQESRSLSFSENNTWKGMLQINRKFGTSGRNLTLRLDGSYADGQSKSSSLQDVWMQVGDPYSKIRYNTTPTTKTSLAAKATYSEPLGNQLFLQFVYGFTYSHQKSDRSTYQYDDMPGFSSWMPAYRNWDGFFAPIYSQGLSPFAEQFYSSDLSKFSQYDNYTHDIQVMIRKSTKQLKFSAGLLLQPQHSDFSYKYQGVDTIVKRNVLNFSPTVDMRWKFSKVSQLRFNYRGTSTQPSMTDLLEIRDDSDPLNITTGNAGLKPSFTQNMRLFYNNYFQNHMQSIMANVNFSTTRNSISNSVTYDETTGGRTTRPENINGNWNIGGAFMYSASIDSIGKWNVNTFTNVNYANRVGYLFRNLENLKNTTRTTTFSERLSLSYRNSWLEVEPNGTLGYTHTRNLLQSNNNIDTWDFNYGLNVNVTLPWGTAVATDAHVNSRRGYSDKSLNTNEFVWNAQVSHSFLKGKALTVSLQFYDILQKQSNLSRTISDMMRSDSEYNTIHSYAMLHVIFKFNSFGGKDAAKNFMPKRGGDDGGERMGPPPGEGAPGGMGTRSGFGGGRPPQY